MPALRARFPILLVLIAVGCACTGAPPVDERTEPATPAVQWALAIHGGAGAPDRSLPEAEKQAYLASLERALKLGQAVLEGGGASLDAVESVVWWSSTLRSWTGARSVAVGWRR